MRRSTFWYWILSRARKRRREPSIFTYDSYFSSSNTKVHSPENSWSMPASMTPQAVKKLIEQRNTSFVQAVDE